MNHSPIMEKGFHKPVKLWATLCKAIQSGWVKMDSSNKMWSTGGNVKPLKYFCLKNPMNKDFDYVDHKKLLKILQEMEYQTTLPVFWEACMQVKNQQLEPDMEQ